MKLTRLILSLAVVSLALHAQQTPAAAPPRLMVLFLDLNSMDSADQTKATDAAVEFVQKKTPSSDVISVMANTTRGLSVLTDFTADRNIIVATLRAVREGIDPGIGSNDGSNDPGASLRAMQTAASMLSKLPEKKVMVYISGGVSKTAIDNQAQMEATVDALMKANVVMYPLDARGLSAAGGVK